MSLKLLDTVPDFTQESTLGAFSFYERAGSDLVALFPNGWTEHTPYLRTVAQPAEVE